MADESYFYCKIEEKIAVLKHGNCYNLELNRVSFNGDPPKFDIRRWGLNSRGKKYPANGITLNRDELKALKDLLVNMEIQ